MNVFDEMRANRAANAEIKRDNAKARREEDRKDREHRQQVKDQRRQARRARLASALSWLKTNPVEVLMALIIVVPGVLAWSAMAASGRQIYGPHGLLLPLFTEAAMWAFAAKLHQARKAAAPTRWLQIGTWSFTAVAAVLNYLHGQASGGWHVGLLMAVVSVGGVVAHQLITATPMRPRKTRSERRAARTQRIAEKRVMRMERAAVRHAVGELTADGAVRLLFQPGVVALRRRGRIGPPRLTRTVVPGLPPAGGEDALDAELRALLNGSWEPSPEPSGTAETPAEEPLSTPAGNQSADTDTDPVIRAAVHTVREAIASGALPAHPSRRKVQAFLGVRASTAQTVLKALRGDGPAGAAA